MRHEIFIRSYRGDIPWLQHCLRSIQKFVTGFDAVHVVVPADQKTEFLSVAPNVEVCGIYREDYMGQQMTKMLADLYCGDACITYIDSDCVFNRPTTPQGLVDAEGKPFFLMTPYSTIDVPWRAPTEAAMNKSVEFEYMRRLPITIFGQHVRQFRLWYNSTHPVSLDQHIHQVQNRLFSEFNAMGAWCHEFKKDNYHWIDTTKEPLPETCVKQNWSWGGLTPEVLAEIVEILK